MGGYVSDALATGAPPPPQRRQGTVGAALSEPSNTFMSPGPVSPEMEAQMDREEAAGAGNWAQKWDEFERMRAEADAALRRYQAGQMSAADTAAAIERYDGWRNQNKQWIEPRIVQPRPWWQFWNK